MSLCKCCSDLGAFPCHRQFEAFIQPTNVSRPSVLPSSANANPIQPDAPWLPDTCRWVLTRCSTEGIKHRLSKEKRMLCFYNNVYYCFLLPFLCNCKLMNREVFGGGKAFVTDLYNTRSHGKVGGGFLIWNCLFNNWEKNCIRTRPLHIITFLLLFILTLYNFIYYSTVLSLCFGLFINSSATQPNRFYVFVSIIWPNP